MNYVLINSHNLRAGPDELEINSDINTILMVINNKINDSYDLAISSCKVNIHLRFKKRTKSIVFQRVVQILEKNNYNVIIDKNFILDIKWFLPDDEAMITIEFYKFVALINNSIKRNHKRGKYSITMPFCAKHNIYSREILKRLQKFLISKSYSVFVEGDVDAIKLKVSWYSKYSFGWLYDRLLPMYHTYIKKYFI